MGVPDAEWESGGKESRSGRICLSALKLLGVEEQALIPDKSVLFGFEFRKFLIWPNGPCHVFPKFFLIV